MGIQFEMERALPKVFRRAFIKRRGATSGTYEADWFEITDFVKNFGPFKRTIDDIRLNRFSASNLLLKCRNDTGKFNPETSLNSFWNTFLTRYRTKIRIEAGYEDDDETELPTDTAQGIFILDGDIKIDTIRNEAFLQCTSLVSPFEETRASDVGGLGPTQSASDLIAKIRDHTDGAGNTVFRQFISSASWTIQTTTNQYNIATTTALGAISTWEFMRLLAESEGFVLNITRSGGIEFRNRDERTSTAAFHFKGEGFPNPTIIRVNWLKEGIDKLFTVIRMKYLEADTTTSFVQQGTTTTVDPDNLTWKYGSKKVEFTNQFVVDTTTAQSIVNSLYTDYSVMKQEMEIVTKFAPQIEILDKVLISYQSIDERSRLWDTEPWASDASYQVNDGLSWDPEEGQNLEFSDAEFKVLSKRTDLDNFTTTFVLREV